MAPPQSIACGTRRLTELEAEVIPCAFGAMAEATCATSNPCATFRSGLFREQERRTSAQRRARGHGGAQEEDLAPVSRLRVGLPLGTTARQVR